MGKKRSTLETRRNLIEAFWSIYRDSSLDRMTIAQVCAKAGYHRATFYRHFQSLGDILEILEEEVSTMDYTQDNPSLYKELVAVTDLDAFIQSAEYKSEYVLKFIGPGGDPNYYTKTLNSLIPLYNETFACPDNEGLLDYALAYLVGGSLTIFRLWHDRGKEISDQAMMKLFSLLHRRGPLAILNPSDDPQLKEELRAIRDCLNI